MKRLLTGAIRKWFLADWRRIAFASALGGAGLGWLAMVVANALTQ